MQHQTPNIGTLDRTLRLFIGPALLVVALAGLLGIAHLTVLTLVIALVFGALLTVTGGIQTCPLYRLVGLDTRLFFGRLG